MDKLMWIYMGFSIVLGFAAIAIRNNIIYLTVFIAALILSKMISIFTINRSIKFIHRNLTEIVNGQLNINIKKSRIKIINELADKINEYLVKTRHLLGEYCNSSEITNKESKSIKTHSENLKIAASEIASTTQNISQAVYDQAASIQRVNDSMESFTNNVQEIFRNADLSLKVARDSRNIVEESFDILREAFSKVGEIKDYNDKVVNDMKELDKSIRQISTITEAVEAIASQTHLLALNASIEAARAGETGRGFAVVAGEISKLADDSSSYAKKIKGLIDAIIGKIDALTSNLEVQTHVIKNNVAFANKALDQSDAINEAVNENMKAAEAIVKLTAEQKESIVNIRDEIESINETAQQNAAISEEITASTQEQLSIIETMYNSINTLNNAIQRGNNIIENFAAGFKITDEIQSKIDTTKKLIEEIAQSAEVKNLSGKELQDYLMEKQCSLKYVEFIAVVNKNGWITDSSIDIPDTELDRQCSSRPYFQEAIKGKQYVSKEYISTITYNYNITVSTPIYSEGQINGIVFADINLSC